jgi:ABC-type transport system substrate-binding protein
VLATGWSVEWRTEEGGHSGGIKAIDFTLRDNVAFHDGSEWNATVAKWNIDRVVWRSGGFGPATGPAGKPGPGATVHWFNAEDFVSDYTSEWNMSWAIGQPATYGGLTNTVAGDGMTGWVSWINETIVVDPLTLRIEFNAWNPNPFSILGSGYGGNGLAWSMISKQTYETNYTLEAIPAGFNQSVVAQLIGTGAYKFVEHDTALLGGGSVERNDDWWNATAMQARGLHKITEGKIVSFARGQAGELARQLALMSGDIDAAHDIPSQPLDHALIANSTNHVYADEQIYENNGPTIYLNCVNDSAYWTNPAVLGIDLHPSPAITLTVEDRFGTPNGIPQPIRKALTYAYDYTTFINTEKEGRAVRAGGVMGVATHPFYNPSVNLPDQDLDIARATMLAAFPSECANRSLDENSTKNAWVNIGITDPIWTGEFHWEDRFEEVKDYMLQAAHYIGCDFSLVYLPDGAFPAISTGAMGLLAASAYAMNQPIPNVNTILNLMIFYKSSDIFALTQQRTRNFAFLDNDSVNEYLNDILLNNGTAKQEAYDNFANIIQNTLYPAIYPINPFAGAGHLKEWESNTVTHIMEIANWKESGAAFEYPDDPIPGYSIPLVAFLSIISLLGIVYHMKRKNRLQ